MDEILTADEVAELLKFQTKKIHELTRRKLIPGVKILNQYRYSKRQIIEHIEKLAMLEMLDKNDEKSENVINN